MMDRNDEPTLFDHMGGAVVLHRLADAQYRRCLTDPVLTQVFGTHGRPGHVEHLAAWLGEVFGGPDSYTREPGGHAARLRHHANRLSSSDNGRRFVEVFVEAADEVSVPTD